MPSWKLSINETERWKINLYEMSFAVGSIRTVSGDVSDAEAINFSNQTHITPLIAGTQDQFEMGQNLFNLYCSQCHGEGGQGDGVASILSPGGYIDPEPANFTESGGDFQYYGQYVWKVKEGVETTNMPPWKHALSDEEMYKTIFYIQNFSTADDYNAKWGPLYESEYARNMRS